MTYQTTYDKYSSMSGDHLKLEDLQQAGAFLEATSSAAMAEWADAHTQTYEAVNGNKFRMVVDCAEDGDGNQVVIQGGEFGNGIAPHMVARAQIIRDLALPRATLVYQPNDTANQPNMNFSPEERRELWRSNLSPMLGRLAVVIDALGNPEDEVHYGPSQGGVVVLGRAAHPDTPAAAVAVVEVPNVIDRSLFGMAKDFLGCGAQLKDIVHENYEDAGSVFAQETLDTLSLAGMLRYMRNAVQLDNLAMTGVMRRDTALGQMEETLRKGGSVIQAYGTVNSVSPVSANAEIVQALASNERHQGVRLDGSDHSVTNQYALNAALVREARNLKRQ